MLRRFCIEAFAAAVLAGVVLAGCDQKPPPLPTSQLEPPVAQPARLPEYRFAADSQRERFPEVSAFVGEFLQTCLAGDYLGYRKLVSRYETPESRERFERIYHGLRSITVERITQLPESEQLPRPCFLVVSEVAFDPESKVALRHRGRKIAILAFQEEGQWRMRPAPSELQPRDELSHGESTTQEAATQPSYPWDESGDF